MKNYGLDLKREQEEQSEQDWVFGALSSPCITDIPETERENYLPRGEKQNVGEEKMDCASRSPINELETKFNWLLRNKKLLPENEKWLRDNGYITENGIEFSDRFIAILSGTTREGNSLKAPIDAIRKNGLVPKYKLPQVSTFNDYHNKESVTGSLLALGQQFLQRFKINYEKVYQVHYKELLKEDMMGVAGYAWPTPVNGEYPKTDSEPNHAFLMFKNPAYNIFDNYEESTNDFIKKLAPDYTFIDYGYRVYITAQYIPSNNNWLADIISNIWQLLFPIKEKVIIKPVEKPNMETNSEKLLKIAQSSLDTDVTPNDDVPDDVACAEVLSTIIKKLYPDFKVFDSTKDLDMKLFTDKRFYRTGTPSRGSIIISPKKGDVLGHCGIFISDDRIASNNSFGGVKGLFTGNYTWDQWIKEFRDKRGLRIYIYQLM